MLNLFTGKISGVLSLTLQGISKAVGLVLNTVLDTVDSVLETVSSLTAPLTDALTELPLIGGTIEKVLAVENQLVGTLGDGLHAVADQLATGDLLCGVQTALNGVTGVVGQTVTEVAGLVDHIGGVAAPITDVLSDLPLLGGLLDAVGETTGNLTGLLAETGDYVASIDPTELLTSVLNDPLASVGGVVQDVSGTLDALLDDIAPITSIATELPVVGDLVQVVGESTTALNQGLYDVGSLLQSVNIDLLQTTAYV
ncbi:hypothetical protein [Acinetobacter sp. YH01005]|uniref:hypothetical protein n=1 Tax=Acinetobacter sp. YH01005 TaxID=2601021 RepID=UPI0015D171DC|nr:hypothetical protein [Acinetobacter sp. YH01005]